MNPVGVIRGRMVPLDRADIDTDQIMPAQHLKRVERTGFGELVFGTWRAAGGFVLDDPARAGAQVLVTGPNFGSGSSREHAPWGLQQWGFRAVVAPSFADIFRNNCAKIGLLTVELPEPEVAALLAVAADPTAEVEIDLAAQTLRAATLATTFAVDPYVKHLLVEGLDDIALTLRRDPAIATHEASRPSWLPTASTR